MQYGGIKPEVAIILSNGQDISEIPNANLQFAGISMLQQYVTRHGRQQLTPFPKLHYGGLKPEKICM